MNDLNIETVNTLKHDDFFKNKEGERRFMVNNNEVKRIKNEEPPVLVRQFFEKIERLQDRLVFIEHVEINVDNFEIYVEYSYRPLRKQDRVVEKTMFCDSVGLEWVLRLYFGFGFDFYDFHIDEKADIYLYIVSYEKRYCDRINHFDLENFVNNIIKEGNFD